MNMQDLRPSMLANLTAPLRLTASPRSTSPAFLELAGVSDFGRGGGKLRVSPAREGEVK